MLSKKDPFLSLPVSRVALSARLNQLAQTNSRPATPASYVSSSLNPNKNTPTVSGSTPVNSGLKSSEELQRFEELSIVKDIRDFEATLTELATAVSSFRDEEIAPSVHKLIDINTSIAQAVGDLQTHQELLHQITELKSENGDLDRLQKNTLRKLIAIRASLRLDPALKSSSTTAQDLGGLDVQTLLDYSMKLAKFSRAPATVQSQMVHPNNYIWPAEDALRRGMLAMASLKPDELIKAELGDEDENMDVVAESVAEEKQNDISSSASVAPNAAERPPASRPSEQKTVPQQVPAPSLDLDLFDDDDSDESNNSD